MKLRRRPTVSAFSRSSTSTGMVKSPRLELADCLKALGNVTGEEVKNMMAEIDTDGDGFISYEEYINFALNNRGLIKDVAKIF
ncbi:hypothetical protein Dsin_012402 [Dipteronia sinensis]|uniref:EF-hand domain-containing protein n=1 Tax=Dipteronia sinensis TaxID=43782 RepID=A0AAE0AI05_9ROSI|nr:hypothetical protein Dsin_012402 [Dipteronia sinensis]